MSFGPDIRRGVAEWNGEGEAVGGIVVMRYGLNALNVISGVKKKLAEISGSLPPGVEVVSGYDRSGLIQASIDTLERDLIEEAIIVSLVIIIFLFHFRSALIPILTLPIAVVASFIPMYYLQVSSNIMSLGGLALAIGVRDDISCRRLVNVSMPTPPYCCHEILGEVLRRGGNPAQRGSIVRHRKIEDGALGHDTSRIYGAMALVVVSFSVIEIDSHPNSRRLKEIARVGP